MRHRRKAVCICPAPHRNELSEACDVHFPKAPGPVSPRDVRKMPRPSLDSRLRGLEKKLDVILEHMGVKL